MQARLVNLLLALPHGVLALSRDFGGLLETSTNLASVGLEGEAVVIGRHQRSSKPSALVRAVAEETPRG